MLDNLFKHNIKLPQKQTNLINKRKQQFASKFESKIKFTLVSMSIILRHTHTQYTNKQMK